MPRISCMFISSALTKYVLYTLGRLHDIQSTIYSQGYTGYQLSSGNFTHFINNKFNQYNLKYFYFTYMPWQSYAFFREIYIVVYSSRELSERSNVLYRLSFEIFRCKKAGYIILRFCKYTKAVLK